MLRRRGLGEDGEEKIVGRRLRGDNGWEMMARGI